MKNDLFIKATEFNTEFRETEKQNDNNPNLRLYCVQFPNYFALQIRGQLPLVSDKDTFRTKGLKKRNLIATIHLTTEEILQLAEYVKTEKDR